jgi:transcriptional regulator with XRE-family HTH domain
MPEDSHPTPLRELRERAGLTVRQLAKLIGTYHTNVSSWERTGRVAKTEFVAPLATALGVTVEEILGLPRSRQGPTPGGKLGQIFESASRLPRSQQQKIIEMAEAYIAQYEQGHAKQTPVNTH